MTRHKPRRYTMQEASAVEAEAIAAIVRYLEERPTTVEVRDVRADPAYRAADIDLLWICKGRGGEQRTVGLEVKADRWHHTGNFFFETQSNKARGTPGCFIYTRADYLLYYFVAPRTLYILPVTATREWFLANQDRFAQRETATTVGQGEHYVTVGRLVPIEEVLANVPGAKKRQL
jgi:hypothetical protein